MGRDPDADDADAWEVRGDAWEEKGEPMLADHARRAAVRARAFSAHRAFEEAFRRYGFAATPATARAARAAAAAWAVLGPDPDAAGMVFHWTRIQDKHRSVAALQAQEDVDTMQILYPCGCCCGEHTSPGCPARLWAGCRGGTGPDPGEEYEAWAAHYARFHGMPRHVFDGRDAPAETVSG